MHPSGLSRDIELSLQEKTSIQPHIFIANIREAQTVSRILIAWELGGNYGHLARCLRVALALRDRGHNVAFVVRDPRTAAEILGKHSFVYFQAPHVATPTRLANPPANFSEILIGKGYADQWALLGMTRAWQALFQFFRPDVVLADHAPTALFAAHIMSIPAIPIGIGLAVPMPVSPQPSIRPWEPVPETRLIHADRTVNTCLEAVAAAVGFKGKRVPTLADLYANALLAFFPEFDHHGFRPNGKYIGPIFSFPPPTPLKWHGNRPHRVIAYLRSETRGFTSLMQALRNSESFETIIMVPGLGESNTKQLSAPHLQIFRDTISIEDILPKADVMISQGGVGTMAQTLLKGVPMLLMPHHVEQYLAAQRINELGASIICEPVDRSSEKITALLEALIQTKSYRDNANDFAQAHAGFDLNEPVFATVAALEAKIRRR
ncbi:MAG: UDP-glucuronosyltransferase [Oxalobacter sp.]|nr:MAG: UDP-glucuronosyltransferase [Oxalobacter sp.]